MAADQAHSLKDLTGKNEVQNREHDLWFIGLFVIIVSEFLG